MNLKITDASELIKLELHSRRQIGTTGSDQTSFSGWQEGRILLPGALKRYQEFFGAAAPLPCPKGPAAQAPKALQCVSTASPFPAWHKRSHQQWQQFCLSACCSLWVKQNLCSIHRRKSFSVRKHTTGWSVTLLLPHPSKDERNNNNSNQKFKNISMHISLWQRFACSSPKLGEKSLKILFLLF